jgi:hypothetical protein
MIGIDAERQSPALQCFLGPAEPREGQSAIAERLHMVGLERDRLVEACEGI